MDTMNERKRNLMKDSNPDPITGEPGSHPVGVSAGTLVGATGGAVAGLAAASASAAAGAALGTAAGPAGMVAGAIVGGIVGAAAGKGLAEAVNPTEEDEFWSKNYHTRPYATDTLEYDTYRPAYRYGVDSFSKYEGRPFEEVEPHLKSNWETARENSSLDWDTARPATRDSYNRLSERFRTERDRF